MHAARMSDPGASTSNAAPTDRSSETDDELLARVQDGDRRAFRILVERYQGLVAETVHGMLGRGAEAQDVGQETFIRFYKTLDRFRGDAKVSTYLTRIAINLSIDALRRRKRQRGRFVSRDDAGVRLHEPSAPHDPDAPERRALVHRAIEALDPKHRAVVVLRMIDGYSTRETAEILGIPQGTVLSRLARAEDKLEAILSPYLNDDDA
jgi:RNA polymerase sigma-70 factor (ECF subfamily)